MTKEFSSRAKLVLGIVAVGLLASSQYYKAEIPATAATSISSPARGIAAPIASSSSTPLQLSIDSLKRRNRIVTAMVKVTNDKQAAFDTVYVHCAFFDRANVAIQDSLGIISGLRPGESAFASVDVVDQRSAVRSADCRIDFTVPVRWP